MKLKNKILLSGLVMSVAMVSPMLVLAEDGVSVDSSTSVGATASTSGLKDIKAENKVKLDAARAEAKAKLEAARADAKAKLEAAKADEKAKRDEQKKSNHNIRRSKKKIHGGHDG